MVAPFMELTRLVIGAFPKEGEQQTWYRTLGRVRPDEIADYYAGLVDMSTTIVVLRNGNSFMIECTIEKFDSRINEYYSFLSGNPDFKEPIYNDRNVHDFLRNKEIIRKMRN